MGRFYYTKNILWSLLLSGDQSIVSHFTCTGTTPVFKSLRGLYDNSLSEKLFYLSNIDYTRGNSLKLTKKRTHYDTRKLCFL